DRARAGAQRSRLGCPDVDARAHDVTRRGAVEPVEGAALELDRPEAEPDAAEVEQAERAAAVELVDPEVGVPRQPPGPAQPEGAPRPSVPNRAHEAVST